MHTDDEKLLVEWRSVLLSPLFPSLKRFLALMRGDATVFFFFAFPLCMDGVRWASLGCDLFAVAALGSSDAADITLFNVIA